MDSDLSAEAQQLRDQLKADAEKEKSLAAHWAGVKRRGDRDEVRKHGAAVVNARGINGIIAKCVGNDLTIGLDPNGAGAAAAAAAIVPPIPGSPITVYALVQSGGDVAVQSLRIERATII